MTDLEIRDVLSRLDERQIAVSERFVRDKEASERALDLAVRQIEERRMADWTESQRRMHELNGSHELLLRQQSKMEAEYLRRETFDREKTAGDDRLSQLKEELVTLKTFNANLQGKLWIGGAIVLILASAITAAVTYIRP